MFTVYVLRNPDGLLYKGYTCDVEKRVEQHNTQKTKWTSGKGPWVLVYTEEFILEGDAKKREKFLKSEKGRELLKEYLVRDASA